jgi:GAF domain-containing protein
MASRFISGALVLCWTAAAQVPLTLEEAAARRPSDFVPSHSGQTVLIKGQVSTKALRFPAYSQLAIQQDKHGLVLEGEPAAFNHLQLGDEVQVRGRVWMRAGLPVVMVGDVQLLSHGAAPAPEMVKLEDLQGFRYLGMLVRTEGRVVRVSDTAEGSQLLIGADHNPYQVFLPAGPHNGFAGIHAGDTVRVIGIASQHSTKPPHSGSFRLLVAHPVDAAVIVNRKSFQPAVVAGLLSALVFSAVMWWIRERRLRAQRAMFRTIYELGEEILNSPSAGEILRKLAPALPKIFRVTRVILHIHNRGSKSLERVRISPDEEPLSIALESPSGVTQMAVATCFQNRTLLAIPDVSRSPFPGGNGKGAGSPRSILVVPMFAQPEVVGVFEMDEDARVRIFSTDEQAVAQHLGNQIGVAIKLSEQRSIREQLFRTEKLAAVGRLISGVVNDLQAPLATISSVADSALAEREELALDRQLRTLSAEARRASKTVARLVSFASFEQVETKPVELNRLLRSLIEFREREWKARGIQARNAMMEGPLFAMGSQGQLEQVFLNLLVYAEQFLADATDKVIAFRTSLLAKRVMVEITYNAAAGVGEFVDPFSQSSNGDADAGLGVCRSIIAGHGGEIRLVCSSALECRFEVEMPWASMETEPAAKPRRSPRDPGHPLTTLVMEPDEATQRELLSMMNARGYRVIPVRSSDEGVDLAQRMRFEVAFCSARLSGFNWLELYERIQGRVGAFVLLSDGYDPELAVRFRGEGCFVLAKPIQEAQLDRVLDWVDTFLKSRLLSTEA